MMNGLMTRILSNSRTYAPLQSLTRGASTELNCKFESSLKPIKGRYGISVVQYTFSNKYYILLQCTQRKLQMEQMFCPSSGTILRKNTIQLCGYVIIVNAQNVTKPQLLQDCTS